MKTTLNISIKFYLFLSLESRLKAFISNIYSMIDTIIIIMHYKYKIYFIINSMLSGFTLSLVYMYNKSIGRKFIPRYISL